MNNLKDDTKIKLYTLELEKLRADNFFQVGYKAANLGEILSMGLKVPLGFVVSTRAFVDLLNFNPGIFEHIKMLDNLNTLNFKKKINLIRKIRTEVKNAVAFYLKAVIKNIHDGGYGYDLDEEVGRLERDFGIIISKTSFLSAIRNPDSLPKGEDLLIHLGVRLTPGCQSTRYWNSMMQDYRKFLDSKEGIL